MDALLRATEDFPPLSHLLLGAAGLWLLYVLVEYRDGRAFGTKPRPDLETIPGIPGLGNLVTILIRGPRQMEHWTELRKKQKDKSKALSLTVIGSPALRIIDVTKPAYVEHVQKTNFSNYKKGELFFSTLHDVLGEGIFVVDGEKWQVQRKATSKIFTGNNFRGVITASIGQDLKKLLTIVGRHADKGEAFDLSALFFRFTLSSFTQMAFGQDIGALSLDTDRPVPFASAFDFAQGNLSNRFNNPFWGTTEKFSAAGRKMRAAVKTIDDFAFGIIDQREKQGLGNVVGEHSAKEGGATDLLSLYMALRDEHGKPMSRQGLRDSVLNLIIAGRDTTAQALSWTFFRLIRHPEHVIPIQTELEEGSVVDYDNYKSFVQTLAAFQEGLRLHPSVPKNAWQAIADDHLPDGGPFVQAGDIVRWGDFEMARMPEVWGPDASEFRPSRWIDPATNSLKKESVYKAHMFNAGPRLCLGQNLALFEATAVMATLLKEFDFSFEPGWLQKTRMIDLEETPRYLPSLTLPMEAPLMVIATRRR